MTREAPDLARQKRFLLPDGTEVQLEYEDTGRTLSDGTPIYRLVSGSGVSKSMSINELDSTAFSISGPWEDEDGNAITFDSIQKLFDGNNDTYWELQDNNGSFTIGLEEPKRLGSIQINLPNLVGSFILGIVVDYVDGTSETIFQETIATPPSSWAREILINSTKLISSITISPNTGAGDLIQISALLLKSRQNTFVDKIKVSEEIFNALVTPGATVETDPVDLENVKALAVSVETTFNASSTSGISVDALVSLLGTGGLFDAPPDFYAVDLEPTFTAGALARKTSLIDPTPKAIKFQVSNNDPTYGTTISIRVLRVY